MSSLIQFLKDSYRNDFGAMMFFFVTGVIALFFIGYLVVDYIKAAILHRRRRKQRHESNHLVPKARH